MAERITIELSADNQASRDVLKLRDQINQLGRQVAENNKLAVTATATERRAIQEKNRALRAEQGLLRVEQQRQSLRVANARQVSREFAQASRGTQAWTRSLTGLQSVLGALGIVAVTQQISEFTITSIRAAGELEQYVRATEQITGSSEAAAERIEDLIEIANLPGLNFEALARFSNRLIAAGLSADDTNKILLTTGQTIVTLGGTAATAALAMEQIIQAVQLGKVDFRDFRTIVQQIPGFLEALGDVHGVEANLDGLHDAFDKTGGSIRDLLIPTFDELATKFESPPSDSYIVVMDELQNATFLLQAAIGDKLLPVVIAGAQGLITFFEAIREGLSDVGSLPEPIQEIVSGAQSLLDALENVSASIGNAVGPSVRELASELASLLGEVLELAGALYNSLEPVFKGMYTVIGVVVAAVAQLVEHITLLVGGITSAVTWISQFWTEEEKAAVATEKLADATEKLTSAQEQLANAGDTGRAKLKQLQTELEATTQRVARYEERLTAANEAGLSNRSTEQFERLLTTAQAQVAALEAEIARLTATYGGATAALGENATESERNTAKLSDLQTQLQSVNGVIAAYEARLANARDVAIGETNPAIEQLERRLAAAQTEATGLETEISSLTGVLEQAAIDAAGAGDSSENYGLALARLKATAEDARAALSETIDFEALGANYSAAIVASDAYYAAQIANAEAALAKEEAASEAYQKIETDLFNLRREQLQARAALTKDASEVGEAEAEKRIASAAAENEKLQAVGEETARALKESQERRTAAAKKADTERTVAHKASLKQREADQKASDARRVESSEGLLEIVKGHFENALPAVVEKSYSNLQKETIQHYELLKRIARDEIKDADARAAALLNLDRERNAALEENHRAYLHRISSDARDALDERTAAFREASDVIVHNWDRTVSEFERRLREAETEDAIREIEGEFTDAQDEMLASLESVLVELGFTAEAVSGIMAAVFRTAETESDGFADKVISALKRLGRDASRETRKQNREVERAYRDLVREVESILGGITDFFFDIANDSSLEEAFKNLGARIGNAILDEFNQRIAGELTRTILSETASTGTSAAATGGGVGSAAATGGSLSSALSVLVSPAALAVLIPAAVTAATYYIGREIVGGEGGDVTRYTNRATRSNPYVDTPTRRRGETVADFEARLAHFVESAAESEANLANAAEYQRLSDPRAPFRRAIQESGIFRGDSSVFAQFAVDTTGVDPFGNVDLPGLVEGLQEVFAMQVENLGDAVERASDALANAEVDEFPTALQDYITTTTDFYQNQIDFINFVRRTTGNLSFGDPETLSRELEERINTARETAPTSNIVRWTPVTEQGRAPGSRFNATTGQYERIPTAGSETGGIEGSTAPEAPAIDLEALETLQTRIASRVANEALGAIREAAGDANITEAEILERWNAAQHALETWYGELLEDAEAIENEAERNEAVAALGSLPDFIANLKAQAVTPVIQGLRRSAEALETRTANRLANEALGAIRTAAEDANVTETEIFGLWESAQPSIETWYNELLEDAQAIENEAERGEAIAALGTLPDFIANLKAQAVTPVISRLESSREALETRIASRVANEALGAIREAAGDSNVTAQTILDLWTHSQPFLETWYNELLEDAEAIENDAERGEAIAALGSLDAFVANLKSQYVMPVLTGLQRSAEALETRIANRLANDALGAIGTAAEDANVTTAEIEGLWTDAVPLLTEWYNELLEDAQAIENDAERGEAVAALGTLDQFVANLKSQYVTPIVTRMTAAAAALETRTAQREANDALQGLREAAGDANVTETEVLNLWEMAIPLLEVWYRELLEDAQAIENDAERTEAIAALGTLDQFVANLKSQYVTPVVSRLRSSAEALETRTANRLANTALAAIREAGSDANVTEAEILNLWNLALPLVTEWYGELLEDAEAIENDAERAEAIAALGTLDQFVANLKSQYVTPITNRLSESQQALETRTAAREANDALGAIRTATEDANVTETEIIGLWTAAVPLLETWYGELLENAQAIKNDAERAEALAALGSLDQFIANLKSQYVTPVISGLRSSAETLETRAAERSAHTALQGIRSATEDANVTEAEIVELWASAQPLLETWYNELLEDAQAIENDAEQAEAIAALGSLDQFIANIESQYVTPIVTGLRASAEALETRTANRLANTALQAIRTAGEDTNITESEIVQLWVSAQPLLETWYNELLEDAQAIENDAERAEAIAALGSLPDFIANLKSQYVTPIVSGIQRSAEALQTRTATREANTALGAIREASEDVNITETQIVQLWTAAVPLLEVWYQELLEDAEAIENDAERAEALAGLGSLSDFVAALKSQYVTPIVTGIASTAEALETRTASRLANAAVAAIGTAASDVNATESEILGLWEDARPLIKTWYEELKQDIENDISLSDAQRTEDLAELGTFADFVAAIREETVAPFLKGLQTRGFQSRVNLSQNAVDRTRFLLSNASSEAEFDTLQTRLVQETNTYYDLELERINGLEVSESELQDLREDNTLARIRALQGIQDMENTFAAERIANERKVAEVARRATERRDALAVRGRRAFEDILIDESGFGRGLRIAQGAVLERYVSRAIQEFGADAFIRDLERNTRDIIENFSITISNAPVFSEDEIREFERIALDQARGGSRP